MVSPLACQPTPLRAREHIDRRDPDFGAICHTTGDDDRIAAVIRELVPVHGLRAAGVAYAELYARGELRNAANAIVSAVDVGPHDVIGWDGTIYPIADERERVPHAGLREAQREQYLSGRWRTSWITYDCQQRSADPTVIASWLNRWGDRFSSPQHMFPSASPNDCYTGTEMPPIIDGVPGLEPMAPGLRYTRAQHESFARLALDRAERNGWLAALLADIGPMGKLRSVRLVGHEDVNPMDRPGWDPGALRLSPWWDWSYVGGRILAAFASTPTV
jgi:hypothetical protein